MKYKVAFQAFLGTNYGTILQSFALYQSIKNLGYECDVVGCEEFRNREVPDISKINVNSKEYDWKRSALTCEHFISHWFNFNEILSKIPAKASLTTMQTLEVAKYDAFVCGSDQIWKPYGFWFCAKRYLQYAPEDKRIGYAPSVGWNKVELKAVGNIPQWKKWLQSVRYLSTRETSGSAIVAKLTGREVTTVVDPTLLLTPSQWKTLLPYGQVSDEINKILMKKKPYLVAYLLDTYEIYKTFVVDIAKKFNLEIVWLTGRDNVGPIQRNCATTDPAGFVQLIRNASFVCVDGFHGTCFSINHSVPFLLLSKPGTSTNDSRMHDLFTRLEISNRIVKPGDDPNDFQLNMKYEVIQHRLENERKKSLDYLSSALEGATQSKGILYHKLKEFKKLAVGIITKTKIPTLPRKNNHVPLDNEDNCTGCGACYNICPNSAISMIPNKHGFLAPVVDEKKCVNCGKCLKRCPIRNRPTLFLREKISTAYAAWTTNPFEIIKSASGGMFPLLSHWILDKGGVVYGVAWDKSLVARTICATSKEEISPIRGSKYVQADTGLTYKDVKNKLDNNIPVLYTGTSCQIAGLYGYLGGDHDLLITIDLICSGTPSPMLLKKYIDWKQRQKKSKIINIEFRSKRKHGWGSEMVLEYENGIKQEFKMQNDEYGILFSQHFVQRPCCYSCRFKGIENRLADITIGDFWGIGKQQYKFNHPRLQGISVVLPNSVKGKTLFQSISADRKNIFVEERNLDEVYPGNAWLLKNYGKREDYEYLYSLFERYRFEEAFDKYFGGDDIRMKINN